MQLILTLVQAPEELGVNEPGEGIVNKIVSPLSNDSLFDSSTFTAKEIEEAELTSVGLTCIVHVYIVASIK